MIEILSDKVVKTRKTHQCFACYRKFEAGTTMRAQTNKYDGIQTVYSCPTCQELMSKFQPLFYDDYEHIYPSECVAIVCSDQKVDSPEELLQKLLSHD